MNNFVKEKVAETAAAAALVALLTAAIGLGAMIQDRSESEQTASILTRAAERALVPVGTEVSVRTRPGRTSLPVRKIFSVSTRDGREVGIGATLIIEGATWTSELIVLMDERGRIVFMLPRNGASGVQSEELTIYLSSREKKNQGGLAAAADARDLEFSVNLALDALRVSTRPDTKGAARP